MKSIADQLPPDIAKQIHPDWRKNEAEYWSVRNNLMSQYQGKWIGFADGSVIASGTSPVEVLHAAQSSGQHPFLVCVGKEQEPARIRRATYSYDAAYPGECWTLSSAKHKGCRGLSSLASFPTRVLTQASYHGPTANNCSWWWRTAYLVT